MREPFLDPVHPSEDAVAGQVLVWSDRAIVPIDAAAIARDVAATRARPRVSSRMRLHAGPASALTATIVIAISITIVWTGGGPWAVESGTDSASATSPRLLPTEIPPELPNGVIDTPIGRARWVHLSGSREIGTLSGALSLMPGPSGLLWFHDGTYPYGPGRCGQRDTCPHPPRLYSSTDAISARVEVPLPVEAEYAHLTQLGGDWWLTTSRPATIWSSSDLQAWKQVDTSGLEEPAPPELGWVTVLGQPIASGGTIVVPVTYRVEAADAGRLLGRSDVDERSGWVWPEPLGDGHYQVMRRNARPAGEAADVVDEVIIEAVDDGLRVTALDGETIAELSGVGLEFIEAWSGGVSVAANSIVAIEAAGVRHLISPDPSAHDVTLVGTDDGFHAYVPTVDGAPRAWRSPDGLTWTEVDAVAGTGDGSVDGIGVRRDGDRWTLVASSFDAERQKEVGWESLDAETWTRLPEAPGGADRPLRMAGGWLALSRDHHEWWASTDGETWERVPALERATTRWTPEGAGGSTVFTLGDALVYAIDDHEQDHEDVWVIEFEPGS